MKSLAHPIKATFARLASVEDHQFIADASRDLVIRAFDVDGRFVERLTLAITTTAQGAQALVTAAGGNINRHWWWWVESVAGTIYTLPSLTVTLSSTNGYSLAAKDCLGPAPGGSYIASQEPAITATISGIATEAKQDTQITSLQLIDNLVGQEYETVAASQTGQVIGATGATGDLINGILVIPASTSPGNVLLLDNTTSITVFAGGSSSVSNLVPFFIPLGIRSVSGAWKITTGSNVSCIAVGDFT